jgi:peptide-methionine (R)-S-oxide reductase
MKNTILALLTIVLFSCNSKAQKEDKNNTHKYQVEKTEAEWKQILSADEYYVLREAGTERPFSSALNNIKEPGDFVCAACGNKLYKTKHKFESGTGWPSFDRATENGVAYGSDTDLGYTRDEIHCARCGGHLGHLFNDGPKQTTGKRHCINGDAMNFIPSKK